MDRTEEKFIRALEKKKRELQDATTDPKNACRDYTNYRENIARIDQIDEDIDLARKSFSGEEDDTDASDRKP